MITYLGVKSNPALFRVPDPLIISPPKRLPPYELFWGSKSIPAVDRVPGWNVPRGAPLVVPLLRLHLRDRVRTERAADVGGAVPDDQRLLPGRFSVSRGVRVIYIHNVHKNLHTVYR